MVIRKDYLMQQIERLAEQLLESRKLLGEGKMAEAHERLQGLLREAQLLKEQGAEGDRARKLAKFQGQLHGELGMLGGATGDMSNARHHLDMALDLVRPHTGQGDTGADQFYAATQMNSGAILAAGRDFDSALVALNEAVEMLTPLEDDASAPPQLRQLWIGALQNRATTFERLDRVDDAIVDYERARRSAESLAETSPSGWTPVVNLGLRIAGLKARGGDKVAALVGTQRALEAAERAVDAHAPGYAGLFIKAKIATADASFANDKYSEGEDHVFAAIEAVPDLFEPVLVAMDFYALLTTKSDEQLEAGGLPRDEVEDSYAELLAKLDACCDDELMCSLARARYDVLVNGRKEQAQALADRTLDEKKTDPRALALQAVLKQLLAAG